LEYLEERRLLSVAPSHGPYLITAGNAGPVQPVYSAASAAVAPLEQGAHPTSVQLKSSPKQGYVGEMITITATVTATGATPEGTIQFSIDNAPYGSPMAMNGDGSASISLNSLTAGIHAVTAAYTSAVPLVFLDSASPAPLDISITVPVLTVTVTPKISPYGQKLPNLTPKITGFINGDTVSVFTSMPAVTTTATATSHVGVYPITVSGGVAPGYQINDVNSTLTVLPAPLIVTADNQIMFAGSPIPLLTASYAGFIKTDTVAAVTTLPKLSTTATSANPPGVYPIVASGAVAPDYTISYVAGTLTILSTSQTASLVPDTIVPGESTLVICGSSGGDTIVVYPGGTNRIVVKILGPAPYQGTFDTTQIAHLVLYGGAGNDGLWIEPGVKIPAILIGGDGNNTLLGGAGPTVLVGSSGRNILRAGSGPTIMIAGSGVACLFGGTGDNLVIGGTTGYDANPVALEMILAEWGDPTAGYHSRVSHLLGPKSALNGEYYLNLNTVQAGSVLDTLSGGPNNTWYLVSPAQRLGGRMFNILLQDVVTYIT
jgi:hypothetical protein